MRNRDGIKAVVLAAGVGSRLDPLTKQFPKPLVPFANRPVMEHVIRQLKRHGFTGSVSNVHYLPDKIINYFGNGQQFGFEMDFVREPRLSGDAGGVRACRHLIEDCTLLVLMGDLISDLDLSYVLDQHQEKGAIATVALKQVSDVERFGVAVLDNEGLITGFQEKPSRSEARSNLASTGVYVLEPEVLDLMPELEEVGFGKHVFPTLVDAGFPVQGLEVWGYWSDVGTIDQYRASTFDAMQGLIDLELPGEQFEHGWRDSQSSIARGANINGLVLLGKNSYISRGVTIEGFVAIGDNCVIQPGARVADSIIWSNSIIGAHADLSNTIVGTNCHIPARARLRDVATIEPENKLGPERVQAQIMEEQLLMEPLDFLSQPAELQPDADLLP